MKRYYILLFACAMAVASCKTDSEDDYLEYLESLNDTSDDDTSADVETTDNALVLNEICGKDDPDDDWLEIYNNGSSTVALDGAYIVKTDEDGLLETIFTFGEGIDIEADGYVVVATLTGELQAGISNKKQVGIALYSAGGVLLDSFDRDADIGEDEQHPEGGSYARMPNGTGAWTIVDANTRGTAND